MAKHPESFLDTNVVLRHILDDKPEQSAFVRSVFEGLRSGEKASLLIESVLAECVHILIHYYEIPKDKVADYLDGVLRYPGIVNQDKADLREALKLFKENNVDFVDCVLVAKSRIGNLDIVTFDESLKKLRQKVT